MTDEQLNTQKAKRPYVVPESMKKYSMNKKELKALRSEHQEQATGLEAEIAELKQAGMTAMTVCYQSKLNELNLQIRLIDALL